MLAWNAGAGDAPAAALGVGVGVEAGAGAEGFGEAAEAEAGWKAGALSGLGVDFVEEVDAGRGGAPTGRWRQNNTTSKA